MPISNITNGESGSDTRTSLNQVIDKVNDIEAAADVTDAGNVGTAIGGATAITTLGDTDQLPVVQTNVLKSITYAALKTLLGALYQAKSTILGTLGGLANAAGFLTNDGAGVLSYTAVGTGVATALGVNLGSAGSVLVTDYAADAGSTDAYVATLNPAPAALVIGAHYRFKANTANNGAATIDFSGLGAKTIVKAAGGITTALADNDIRAGQWVDVVWDGTNMQMQSTLGNAGGGGPPAGGDSSAPGYAFAGYPGIGMWTQGAQVALTIGTNYFASNGSVLYCYPTVQDLGIPSIPWGKLFLNNFVQLGQISTPSPATDAALFFSKNVAGTAEAFVMDEAGNETQISPHNSSAPAQLFDSPFDEIKTTCNYYTGIIWHKNTQRQLAGRPDAQVIETFEECLARLGADCDPMIAAGAWDWDTMQAGHVAKSVAARADWAVRKSEWEANPKNQDKPFPEEQPKLVVAKPMPKTLTDQLAGKVEFLAQREASGTTVSKTSMLLAMAERGFYDPNDHTTGLLAAIASMSDPAQKAAMQIYFTSETVVKRFNPVVLGLQAALGLDDAAVDALFVAAKVKDNEP